VPGKEEEGNRKSGIEAQEKYGRGERRALSSLGSLKALIETTDRNLNGEVRRW